MIGDGLHALVGVERATFPNGPVQWESTTVRKSDTLEVRCGAASGVREERARCALGVQSDLASSPGAARSKLTTSRVV